MTDAARADVAVIGGGPAGLAAASRAAECGASVLVLDHAPDPGGQIWRHRERARLPRAARQWLGRFARCGARWIGGASVIDIPGEGELTYVVNEGAVRVTAAAIVLATGARELFLPFPGWTLPNVMGVGGAQALLKGGAWFAGRRVVIAGSGPLLLPVAAAMTRHGARVRLVAEQAPGAAVRRFARSLWRSPRKLAQAARYRAACLAAPYRTGVWVERASGDDRVREVTLTNGRRSWSEPCDLACCGFGLVPNVELARLAGCELSPAGVTVDTWQRTTVAGMFAAGECAGIAGEEAALVEGEIAGLAAAGRDRAAARLLPARDRARAFGAALASAFRPRDELRALARGDTIVCRCEDVPFGALRAEWSARQGKLYARAGMGACQGRVCGAALAFLLGWEQDSVRVPAFPAAVSALMPPDTYSS